MLRPGNGRPQGFREPPARSLPVNRVVDLWTPERRLITPRVFRYKLIESYLCDFDRQEYRPNATVAIFYQLMILHDFSLRVCLGLFNFSLLNASPSHKDMCV